MEDKGPTTSAAAAVADGASTVSAIKSGTNESKVGSKPSSTGINLLIKASNQQHPDMSIESDLLWTVKRLKMHLSLVHPSKPLVHDQKLIYSGQLLTDQLLLKEVIRSYKDVYTQNHIIHLVCSNKNMPLSSLPSANRAKGKCDKTQAKSSTVENDGGTLQRETDADTIQYSHQHWSHRINRADLPTTSNVIINNNNQQQQQCPPVMNVNQNNIQALINQQVIMYNWIQQVYSQYMDNYIRLSNASTDINNDSFRTENMGPNSVPFTPHTNSVPQFFGYNAMPSVIGISYTNGMMHINSNSSSTNIINEEQVSSNAMGPITGQLHPTQILTQQQAPIQPEVAEDTSTTTEPAATSQYPNIIQEETDNHDWLDDVLSFVRFIFFLALLYVNSSTQRCLVVFTIMAVMYCYHLGTLRRRNERNNNNINRNNNAADRAASLNVQSPSIADNPNQQNDQGDLNNTVQIASDLDNRRNSSQNSASTSTALGITPNTSVNERTNNNSIRSAIAFLQTFITSFFTSLFPEAPVI